MTQYFGVTYLTDGTMQLWPGKDQQDCLRKLREVRDSKWGPRLKATTVIKRDMTNFKDGLIFGSPKSLNVVAERKKNVR